MADKSVSRRAFSGVLAAYPIASQAAEADRGGKGPAPLGEVATIASVQVASAFDFSRRPGLRMLIVLDRDGARFRREAGDVRPPAAEEGFSWFRGRDGDVWSLDEVMPTLGMFGARSDRQGADSSAAVNAALGYVSRRRLGELHCQGAYVLSNTVYVPANVRIVGTATAAGKMVGATWIPKAGGAFKSGYMFVFNSRDAVGWEIDYPQYPGGMSDCFFDNSEAALPDIKAILAFGAYEFDSIRSYNFLQTIVRAPRPPGTKRDEYNDHFIVRRFSFYLDPAIKARSTEYQIDLQGGGDATLIELGGAHFGVKTLRVRGTGRNRSSALTVQHCIGGDYWFENAPGAVMRNCHLEGSRIRIAQSSMAITDCVFQSPTENTAPTIQIEAGPFPEGTRGGEVVLERLKFLWGFQFKSPAADVSLCDGVRLVLRDCQRLVSLRGDDTSVQAVRLARPGGGAIEAYDRAAHVLSSDGVVALKAEGAEVQGRATIQPPSGGWRGVASAEATGDYPAESWRSDAGEFTYAAALVFDAAREVGLEQALPPARVGGVKGGGIVRLRIDWTDCPGRAGLVRLVRTRQRDQQSWRADVPLVSASGALLDAGDTVSGVTWTPLSTAEAAARLHPPELDARYVLDAATGLSSVGEVYRLAHDEDVAVAAADVVVVHYDGAVTAEREVRLPPAGRCGARVRIVVPDGQGRGGVVVKSTDATTLARVGAEGGQVELMSDGTVWRVLAAGR